MGRTPHPYTLYLAANGIWYYTISWTAGVPDDLCERRKSTRKTSKPDAMIFVQDRIAELKRTRTRDSRLTFGEYAAPFYGPDCPHHQRVGHGKVSPETLVNRRGILVKKILTDELSRLQLRQITVADLAAFRERVRKTGLAPATVKRVMDIVRVVMREATYNRLIPYDPALALPRIGKREGRAVRGVFTLGELRAMFAERPGIWGSDHAWLCFRLAAVLGLRDSEVRALRVRDVGEVLHVRSAWKSDTRLGLPKWGRTREAPLPDFLRVELDDGGEPDDFLVRSPVTGRHVTDWWWRDRFRAALKRGEIPEVDANGRKRVPHSFRHTLQTQLITHGISRELSGLMLGHETGLTQVQDDYVHMAGTDFTAVVAVLEELFGRG